MPYDFPPGRPVRDDGPSDTERSLSRALRAAVLSSLAVLGVLALLTGQLPVLAALAVAAILMLFRNQPAGGGSGSSGKEQSVEAMADAIYKIDAAIALLGEGELEGAKRAARAAVAASRRGRALLPLALTVRAITLAANREEVAARRILARAAQLRDGLPDASTSEDFGMERYFEVAERALRRDVVDPQQLIAELLAAHQEALAPPD